MLKQNMFDMIFIYMILLLHCLTQTRVNWHVPSSLNYIFIDNVTLATNPIRFLAKAKVSRESYHF